MPSIVARSIPKQNSVCSGRSMNLCTTPPLDASGLVVCTFTCPTSICPVHHQNTQLYCSETCFITTHAQSLNRTIPSSPNPLSTPSPSPPIPSSPAPAPSSPRSSRPRGPARVGKYVLGRKLGQGTFGKVKLAVNSETGERVALKMMDKGKIKQSAMGEQIKKEIAIMKTLKHRNIIQLKEVLASPTTIYLVLELVEGGELFNVIVEQGKLEEDEAREYFRQLVSGLAFCHSAGVCHRDLKPENLLLDDEGVMKISDFGLSARQLPSASPSEQKEGEGGEGDEGMTGQTPLHLLHTTCGTPNYVAPEVLMDKGYDGKAADVWSAGVILFVLLAGYLPFDEVSMVDLFRKIVKADFSYPPHFSDEAIDLLNRILTPKVEQRATMAEIQRHPWMMKGRKEEEELDMTTAERSMTGEALTVIDTLSSQPSPAASPRLSAADGGERSVGFGLPMPQAGRQMSDSGVMVVPVPITNPSDPANASLSISLPPSPSPSPSPPPYPAPHSFPRTDSRLLLTMDEDEEEEEVSQRRTLADPSVVQYGPRKMNAFDLINMVGGQAMNRMFVRGLGGKGRQMRSTQFTSVAKASVLLDRLNRVLKGMEGVECEVSEKYAQVRAVKEGDRGQVALCAQVYGMTPSLCLVECRKLKGDMFLYYDMYKEVKRRMERMEKSDEGEGEGGGVEEREEKKEKEEKGGEAEEDTVIKAGTRTLTISRPGSGSGGRGGSAGGSATAGSGSGDGSGGGLSHSTSMTGSGMRGKLSIMITPNTPIPRGPEEEVEGESSSEGSSGASSGATPSSLLYNPSPQPSPNPVTPQPLQD